MGDAGDTATASELAAITADQLSRHVNRLAADIGVRNVFHPQALQMAEDYLRECWQQQDYHVTPQDYVAMGVRSANLEITRRGSRYPDQIILLRSHYDSVRGSPGANHSSPTSTRASRCGASPGPFRHPRIFPCSMFPDQPWFPVWPEATTCHYGASAIVP